MIRICLLLLLSIQSYALTIGTYNVENLFDGELQGGEYYSYIPGNKMGWNKELAAKKLKNISEAILKIEADILAVQEVENHLILKELAKNSGYKYSSFANNKEFATGVGLLSKYPIKYSKTIKGYKRDFRPALYSKVEILDETLEIIVVHLPSLKNELSKKEAALNALLPTINEMKEGIILGDFNDPFSKDSIIGKILGPLEDFSGWHDPWVSIKNRWSHDYLGQKQALDRILLSEKLFDKKGLDFVCGSFKPLHKEPFMKDGAPYRWQISDFGKGRHLGKGYSDHVPLILKLENKPFNCEAKNITIKELYDEPLGDNLLFLEKAVVIYSSSEGFILADKSGSIFVHKPGFKLPLGVQGDFYIHNLSSFGGVKEIKAITLKKRYEDSLEIDSFFKTNIMKAPTHSVLKEVSGSYKNGFLHTKDTKIKVHAFNKNLLPKNGKFVKLYKVRVGEYRGVKEIILEERE
ncbi:MAG: endonuclease/exonuclease/phosphatase family protein [Campylobacterales bacterium]|nr:endonuclease/exonuclease/phosphatase family protein [Campylobacterales bacterium]